MCEYVLRVPSLTRLWSVQSIRNPATGCATPEGTLFVTRQQKEGMGVDHRKCLQRTHSSMYAGRGAP